MNPLWVEGSVSPNPTGRPKSSSRTVRGMVERFIKRNVTPNKLSKIFNQLSPKDQAEMLLQLLPFAIARQQPDSISNEEVNKLYDLIEKTAKQNAAIKAS